jgi:endonuclease/exonuclease/phosphatase family metal-dependent hydrolase
VLSRWPIEEVRTLRYDACSSVDCMATKGAVHATVRVSRTERLHVVNTHLNAGRSEEDRRARAAQIEQLRAFVDEIDTETGPVVMLGDFNVDALAETGEFEEFLETFEVEDELPPADASTYLCSTNVFCDASKSTPKRYDYIFTDPDEHRLLRTTTRHITNRTDACGKRVRYLSDHRAVRASFETQY